MIIHRRKGGLAATSPSELAAKAYRDMVTEFKIGVSNFCRGTFGLTRSLEYFEMNKLLCLGNSLFVSSRLHHDNEKDSLDQAFTHSRIHMKNQNKSDAIEILSTHYPLKSTRVVVNLCTFKNMPNCLGDKRPEKSALHLVCPHQVLAALI